MTPHPGWERVPGYPESYHGVVSVQLRLAAIVDVYAAPVGVHLTIVVHTDHDWSPYLGPPEYLTDAQQVAVLSADPRELAADATGLIQVTLRGQADAARDRAGPEN